MEAVKQGSTAIGLRSKTHVVLGCVNKAQSELSSHQRKIFRVDDHIGVAIADLTADDRPVYCAARRQGPGLHSAVMETTLLFGLLVFKVVSTWAFVIDSLSQAAKTYLERRFETFKDASRDELIKHALFAIRETLQGEKISVYHWYKC